MNLLEICFEITEKYKNGQKMANFVVLSVFFVFFVFSGPNPGWGISYFFRISSSCSDSKTPFRHETADVLKGPKPPNN